MDPTAYSIWYHVGCLSHSLKNLRFARLAYENGIFTNEETRKKSVLDVIRSGRFTPIQWNCFEGLCKVSFFYCKTILEYRVDHIMYVFRFYAILVIISLVNII